MGIARGLVDSDAFRTLARLLEEHYEREEPFLQWLDTPAAALAAKLRAQHAEAMEIAARLQECFGTAETRDIVYLARRLLAIAQHNIIEEERDVFPMAGS